MSPTSAPGVGRLILLSALMGFASISTDFYLPAMPTMARDLAVSQGEMQWSISGYLVGFSAGMLVWGPLADRFGRKRPVAAGLVLFIIGSAGCALCQSGTALLLWRLIQATGACAGVVLSRAMVRDLIEGPRAAQMLSTLITIMAVAPLIGPWAGAQIMVLSSWRVIFWTLVFIGLVTLAGLAVTDETLPPTRRRRQTLSAAMRAYAGLLSERATLGYAGTGACLYAAVYAYIAGTPFAFITYYHLPAAHYGLLFGTGIAGIMLVNQINIRLLPRLRQTSLLRSGAGLAAASGLLTALAGYTGWGGLWGLAVPLFVLVSSSGLIVANSVAGALAAHPHRAGAVSALVGALHYGSGCLSTALVGLCANGTPAPMGAIIGLCGLGCAVFAGAVLQTGPRVGGPVQVTSAAGS